MSIKFTFTHALLLVTALPLTACTSSRGLEEEHTGIAQQMKKTRNGLTSNGLTSNGLTSNGLSSTGIDLYALTEAGLNNNTGVMTKMSEQYSLDILDYITSCALPAGDDYIIPVTINSTTEHVHGSLSLAPQWNVTPQDAGPPPCDAACQTWVSGCIISRLNYLGVHVDISLRGHGIETSQEEITQYETPEAVYFGDLFSSTPRMYACRIGGSTLVERVCGPADGNGEWPNCPVTVLPSSYCADNCSAPDSTDGHYENCADPAHSGQHFAGSVTIYRDMVADAGTD